MQKLIRIEPAKCVGCKTCELACSFKNAGEFAPSKSRIYNEVFLEEAKFITVTCMQCDEPWCEKACPKAAISKEVPSGVVYVDEHRCVGCRTCVSACPFGMIKYLAETGKAEQYESDLLLSHPPFLRLIVRAGPTLEDSWLHVDAAGSRRADSEPVLPCQSSAYSQSVS